MLTADPLRHLTDVPHMEGARAMCLHVPGVSLPTGQETGIPKDPRTSRRGHQSFDWPGFNVCIFVKRFCDSVSRIRHCKCKRWKARHQFC
jgi:hypothetical protein